MEEVEAARVVIELIQCWSRRCAGKLLERTMMQKFGPAEVNDHFMSFNTICDATQVSALARPLRRHAESQLQALRLLQRWGRAVSGRSRGFTREQVPSTPSPICLRHLINRFL